MKKTSREASQQSIERMNRQIEKEMEELNKLADELELCLNEPLNNGTVFCPICGDYFPASDHLASVISDPGTLWLANMVTHYRHTHIRSWKRCWDHYSGNRYRSGWFGDYDEEKQLVNERAKRQIIRKCDFFMTHHSIGIKQLEGLEYNDPKTIELEAKRLKD